MVSSNPNPFDQTAGVCVQEEQTQSMPPPQQVPSVASPSAVTQTVRFSPMDPHRGSGRMPEPSPIGSVHTLQQRLGQMEPHRGSGGFTGHSHDACVHSLQQQLQSCLLSYPPINNCTSPTTMSGSWQSEGDTPQRRVIINQIVELIKVEAADCSLESVIGLAKLIELSLYRNAPSFEAYADTHTLKERMAIEMSRKVRMLNSQNDRRDHPNRMDPEKRRNIRHKQQRLLLLYHSAVCPMGGKCVVTPHCSKMKELWRHLKGCRDKNCPFPHCVSSRLILTHYTNCKNRSCLICQPIRNVVRRSSLVLLSTSNL